MIPVITRHEITAMRWGMIPSWVSEVSTKYATFNARLESVATKPTFRNAWNQGHRCLIPALGYYEWKKENGEKQPYFVQTADASPLAFAGLFEPGRGDNIPASCTIITLPATGTLVDLHPRMPIMLGVDNALLWLSAHIDFDSPLSNDFQMHKVSKAVNSTTNQDASLVEPLK